MEEEGRGLRSLRPLRPTRCPSVQFLLVTLVIYVSLCTCDATGSALSKLDIEKKVILILVDGVRYDYTKDESLKGFPRMAKAGVRAEYVQPIFPANSYPNWYTIVTGLFGESHGMVQNFMYDADHKDTFLMFPHPNASHSHWWSKAEPLWVTSEKQGVRTAVYWWDGCQVPIKNVTPSFCLEYQSYWTWPKPKEDTIDAMNEILDNFQRNEWQLGLVYYEAIDATGHAWGPESNERKEATRDFDDILDKLQDEIDKRKLGDEVSVVVVSDHGMINVDSQNRKNTELIDIEKIVDQNDVEVMLDRGSMAFLIPKEGRVDKVYDVLKKANRKGLRVYKKDRIPTKYHIKHSSRTAPILLVAEKGYFVRGFSKQGLTKPVWDVIYSGHHGYDPYDVKEMRTIMYARGPGLKHDYTSKPLMMTDHYNLICHQLDIDARPNNGSWLRVQGMLEDTADSNVVYRQLRSSTHPTISNYYLLILSAFTSILLSFVPVST